MKQPVRPPVLPKTSELKPKRSLRGGSAAYSFMRSPTAQYAFEVGDVVEALCDHEKGSDRVRGWLKGIVVQIDNKMVAVQFRSNVFLTDGWMVPDRILWYPTNSEQLRPAGTGKKSALVVKKSLPKDDIPDY